MNQQELTTERLILRSFNVCDAADVHRMAGNFNVAKITLNIPHSYEDGMAEEWINSHPKMFDAGVQLSYAITHCCPVNRNKKGLNLNELLQCKCDQTL